MPIYRNIKTGLKVEVMPGTRMSKAYELVTNNDVSQTTISKKPEKNSTKRVPKPRKTEKKSPKKVVLKSKADKPKEKEE